MQFATSISSGGKTASAVISDKGCFLSGVLCNGVTATPPTLILYDNATEASGKILYKFVGITAFTYTTKDWKFPVECVDGIYASISGASGMYTVEYMKK